MTHEDGNRSEPSYSATVTRAEHSAGPMMPWATWRAALWLVLIVTLARVLWLVFVCPYELAADEAQYWDWSRRLDWSYYSKGPGVAWAIAASTSMFGHAEWAVRLPTALATGVAMLAVARLAVSLAGGDRRAGVMGVLAFIAVPAYHATATFMTIDGPYVACWAVACFAAWSALVAGREGASRAALLAWLTFGAAVGIGFLFKYTILLLVPGVVIAVVLERGVARRQVMGILAAAVVASVLAGPVFIWNAQHGWPTVAHLLGHLGAAGGDMPTASPGGSGAGGSSSGFSLLTAAEFVGTQAGIIGPALGLMVVAWLIARRDTKTRPAARFALACAAPILVFYVCVSFFADAEGNWPIAGYVSLLALAGAVAPCELARYLALVRHWRADAARPRPRQGYLRAAPETPFQLTWHWSLAWGIAGAVGVASLSLLDRLPILGDVIPLHRIAGHRVWASQVDEIVRRTREEGGSEPFVIADQYTRAALLAYYLPERPSVRSATSFLGGRRSSYDYFPDTSLRDPVLAGRTAVLAGAAPERWSVAFRFDAVEPVLDRAQARWPVYLGRGFHGPSEP